MKTKEQQNKIIVSFHIGRGGRFNNSGYKSYLGEKTFKDLISMNEDNLYIVNRDKQGKFIKPIFIDGSSNEVSDDNANSLTGSLNFDGDYDTYIAKDIEDCTDKELDIIRNSNEWKSSELNEYLELRDKYDMQGLSMLNDLGFT